MKAQGDVKKRLEKFKGQKIETLAIHGGQGADPHTGSLMPPIYQTSTYAQKEPSVPLGEFEYTRSHNPTRRMLEDCLALLEGGTYAMATPSGMSATDLIISTLNPGDEVICCDDVYGGTFRLFNGIKTKLGLKFKFISFDDVAAIEKASTDNTKLLWMETPSNPLMKIIDIELVSKLAKAKGWVTVVDNTFATPINQRPLELGADIVMHSMTKYLNGHSDVVAGCVILNDEALADELYVKQYSIGHALGPFDSWCVLRGLKTLAVRMNATNTNAVKIATFLEGHPSVEKVFYPGLKSNPGHEIAAKQMKNYSGMMSFYIKGGMPEVKTFCAKLKVFTLAESLGGVESLVNHPATMTHASIPEDIREKNGIWKNLIRLSVGIENVDDLIADLEQAF